MQIVKLVKIEPLTDRILNKIALNREQEERADRMVPGDFLRGFTYHVDFDVAADILRCDIGDVMGYGWLIEIV